MMCVRGCVQGPYIYKVKFSSFGRHFTTTQKLDVVTNELMFFLRPGITPAHQACGVISEGK